MINLFVIKSFYNLIFKFFLLVRLETSNFLKGLKDI